jgi:hypothetical protein
MGSEARLPGLERLVAVCRQHGLPWKLLPPGQAVPKAGARVGGYSFDAVLSAIYSRVGGATFGQGPSGLHLFRFDDQINGLEGMVEEMGRADEEPFRSALLFATVPGQSSYFATVPALADGNGIQPVVYIDAHEETQVVPVASNADHFLATFSRYLEAQVASPGYSLDGVSLLLFPWDVSPLIAEDLLLVEMLRAGCFEPYVRGNEEARDWVARLTG